MNEPRSNDRSETSLERELSELGPRIAFPSTPDLAAAVREALEGQRVSPVPPVRQPRRFEPRRLLLAAAVVVVALVAGLMLSGGFRESVAGLFGVRGVRITIERDTPTPSAPANSSVTATAAVAATPSSAPIGSGLLLGQRVSLAEAQRAVPYAVSVPAALGAADEVYLRTLPNGTPMVSLIYLTRPDLPETAETGVGALLMEFVSPSNDLFVLAKRVSEGYDIEVDEIDGRLAIWIDEAHALTLAPDPSRGCCEPEETRPAGHVLLWEAAGVTYRLESSLTKEQALAIASSMSSTLATPVATPAPGN